MRRRRRHRMTRLWPALMNAAAAPPPPPPPDANYVTYNGTQVTYNGVEVKHSYSAVPAVPPLYPSYYVDATLGNDANDGLSRSQPKQTIAAALGSDRVIHLRGGRTWVEHVVLTSLSNVVIKSYGEGCPVIDGEQDVFATSSAGGGLPTGTTHTKDSGLVHMSDCYNVSIEDLHVKRSRYHGIHSVNSDQVTVRGNYVEETRSAGIYCKGTASGATITYLADGINILNNLVKTTNASIQVDPNWDGGGPVSGSEGISVSSCTNIVVRRNELTDHYKEGIDIKNGCSNAEVDLNYVHDFALASNYTPSASGIYIDAYANGATNITVKQNVLQMCKSGIAIGQERGATLQTINVLRNSIVDSLHYGVALKGPESGYEPGQKNDIRIEQNTILDADATLHGYGNITTPVRFSDPDDTTYSNVTLQGNIIGTADTYTTDLATTATGAVLPSGITSDNNMFVSANNRGYLAGTNQVTSDELWTTQVWANTPVNASCGAPATATVEFIPTSQAGLVNPSLTSYDLFAAVVAGAGTHGAVEAVV